MLRGTLLADVPHGFTGVAEGDLRPGSPGCGAASRGVVARLGGGGELVVLTQVHGATVLAAEGARPGDEGDALVSTTPGQVVAVRVADCVPILLAGPAGDSRGVAAVHAGWRGTAQGIAGAGARALAERSGARLGDLRAVIGPCICARCYEVGGEVIEGVGRATPGAAWRVGERHVDLQAANAAQLRALGVRVEVLAACTRCGEGYWSHRRDGAAAGRQAGVIALPGRA